MYRIIGVDQKEYGPVGADELRRWVTERRLNGSTLIRAEGTSDWKPLSLFPEFSSTLASLNPAPFSPSAAMPSVEQRSNSMATTGLVFSCFSLICCGCSPAAILGIVFSAIGLSQASADPAQSGKGVAIAGIAIGIISLLGNIFAIALGAFGGLIEGLLK